MRAVEHNVKPVEPMRQGLQEVEDVTVLGIGESADPTDAGARRLQLLTAHGGLDARLDDVGQLHAAASEDLDAVVGSGVVGCRHHDPEVGVMIADEVGQGWRGKNAGIEDVDARGGESRRNGGDEELPRDARIPCDDSGEPLTRGAAGVSGASLAQDDSGRLGQGQREIGGEDAVGKPSYAVRAEQRHGARWRSD